jgi:hypothetical protein
VSSDFLEGVVLLVKFDQQNLTGKILTRLVHVQVRRQKAQSESESADLRSKAIRTEAEIEQLKR